METPFVQGVQRFSFANDCERVPAGNPLTNRESLFRASVVVGLTTHVEAWIVWCVFGAACALLVDALGGGFTIRRTKTA